VKAKVTLRNWDPVIVAECWAPLMMAKGVLLNDLGHSEVPDSEETGVRGPWESAGNGGVSYQDLSVSHPIPDTGSSTGHTHSPYLANRMVMNNYKCYSPKKPDVTHEGSP
jgi:hypothetical protein